MAIIKKDRNWNILFDQIVKGNVIPVIGPELVELGDTTSLQKIIDEFAETWGIGAGENTSFSQFVFYPKFKVWAEGTTQSEYVEKERKAALELAYPNCKPREDAQISIKPYNIQPYATPPKDMIEHYHFEEL